MSESQQESYRIFCLFVDEDSPFSISTAKSALVDDLKKLIKQEKPNRLASVDANLLKLYQVDIIGSKETIEEKLKKIKLDLDKSKELYDLTELSELYPSPPFKAVHILIELPVTASLKRKANEDPDGTDESRARRGPRHSSPSIAELNGSTAQRRSTVDALYERLNKYRLVMVRGTPASGKSTLAQLLEKYIRTKEPESDPILVNSWPRYESKFSWHANLMDRFNDGAPNICIIDEGQLSYWDSSFWNGLLKMIRPESKDRVILFVSYGSPNRRVSVEGTPMILPELNRVGLQPVDHGDGIAPAGLFLTSDEFNDMVQKKFPAGRFKTDFLDYVFRMTAGQAGAIEELLRVVLAHNSYNSLKYSNEEYSMEMFRTQLPLPELWKALDLGAIFRRGLPTEEELGDLSIARVFRAVISNNHVTKQQVPEDEKTLDQCFKNGWLHATMDQGEIRYIFTTPLHQWFVEHHLGKPVPGSTLIDDQELSDFAFKVIQRFSRIQLSSPRQVGASNVQRPPEAQFQDEFYRCCSLFFGNCLSSYPEFGNSDGKVDFFIPSKNWGVELLRDGNRLENHSSRFIGTGAYAQMKFTDYIILDFRQTQPRKAHPGIPKLYHVIFEEGYNNVRIRSGSSLETVAEFGLLN